MATILPYPSRGRDLDHRDLEPRDREPRNLEPRRYDARERSGAERRGLTSALESLDANASLQRTHDTAHRARAFVRELQMTTPAAVWDDERRSRGSRLRRILTSILHDVDAGGTARVRQITSAPFALYRIEVERPDMAYVRTTVMGDEALTALLEETSEDLLRERFIFRRP